MSQENVEIVRTIYAAWDRGDFSSREWADAEIEFVVADGLNPSAWRGLSGLATGFGSFLGAWESLHVAVDEIREIDEERILVFTHLGGRGKTSGLQLEQMQTKQANLLEIRDGKVIRLVVYNYREHALADLGLRG